MRRAIPHATDERTRAERMADRLRDKRDRRGDHFFRSYHSEARVDWVREQRCAVPGCKSTRQVNAHRRTGGTAMKAGFEDIVPLCKHHHDESHWMGIGTWQKLRGVDLEAAAAATQEAWQRFDRGNVGGRPELDY